MTLRLFVSITMILLVALSIHAQEESDYYVSVESEKSNQDTRILLKSLDIMLDFYNNQFRFDEDVIADNKLRVNLFESRDNYEDYLGNIQETTPELTVDIPTVGNFVYLHYDDPSKNILVGYHEDMNLKPDISLVRQSFMQFLRAFSNNPPPWLRGFSLYYENIQFTNNRYDELAPLKPSPAWLTTLQSVPDDQMLSLEDFMQMNLTDARTNKNVFYPMAWGFAFFLDVPTRWSFIRRTADSLEDNQEAELIDNIQNILEEFADRTDMEELNDTYLTFIQAEKTPNAIIEDGRVLYEQGMGLFNSGQTTESSEEFEKAKEQFELAITAMEDLQDDTNSYVAYYYVGLINYMLDNFSEARRAYQRANVSVDDLLDDNPDNINLLQNRKRLVYAQSILEYEAKSWEDAKQYLDAFLEQNNAFLRDSDEDSPEYQEALELNEKAEKFQKVISGKLK